MPPTATTPPPPPADHRHHSKKSKLKTTIHSFKSQISSPRCACLTAALLLQLHIVLLLLRHAPPLPLFSSSAAACKHGRIYVYDLPPMLNKDLIQTAVSHGGLGPPAAGLDGVVPASISAAWHWTEKYSAEVIYHHRMYNYTCTTYNPAEATAFYIPFYAGLAVEPYLLGNHTWQERDRLAAAMVDWVKNQPPFLRSNGSDHFLVLGRLTWDFRRLTDDDGDWGTSLLYMPAMKHVLRLCMERMTWDDLDISVPYPTSFHPRSESDIRVWQNSIQTRKRPNLFTFVGAARKWVPNDFRTVLMQYCKNESTTCHVVDCDVTRCYDGSPDILEAFLNSDFCLQPKGDGLTRRSAYDCMVAGSIPVYSWTGSFEGQYEWHLPENASDYSVFIDHNAIRNDTSIIRRTLESYSREKVKKMRETIINFLPRIIYSKSNSNLGGIRDAFDISMERILKRFEQQRNKTDGLRLE